MSLAESLGTAQRFHSHYSIVFTVTMIFRLVSWGPFTFEDLSSLDNSSCPIRFKTPVVPVQPQRGAFETVNQNKLAQEGSEVPSCMCHCPRHFLRGIS